MQLFFYSYTTLLPLHYSFTTTLSHFHSISSLLWHTFTALSLLICQSFIITLWARVKHSNLLNVSFLNLSYFYGTYFTIVYNNKKSQLFPHLFPICSTLIHNSLDKIHPPNHWYVNICWIHLVNHLIQYRLAMVFCYCFVLLWLFGWLDWVS